MTTTKGMTTKGTTAVESAPAQVLLEHLSRALPADRLLVDPAVLQGLSHDEAEWAAVGRAEIAVRARTEAEVAATVRVAADLGVPIVSRGAGTGLSGGANAVDGCIILDLSKMNAIVDIDPDNLTCVVQPGRREQRSQGGRRRTGPVVPAGPGQRARGRRSAAMSPPTPAGCVA